MWYAIVANLKTFSSITQKWIGGWESIAMVGNKQLHISSHVMQQEGNGL